MILISLQNLLSSTYMWGVWTDNEYDLISWVSVWLLHSRYISVTSVLELGGAELIKYTKLGFTSFSLALLNWPEWKLVNLTSVQYNFSLEFHVQYLNPIPTRGSRFCPPSQRSHLNFPCGYVPASGFKSLRMHTQGCHGCQMTRDFVRKSKILIPRSTIQPKLSKIKNH